MKTKGHWVIKTSAGGYWCSGSFDPQLRKAHIYHWKEKAEEQIQVFIKRKYLPSDITFEVIAIRPPQELKDAEADWTTEYTENEATVYCSYCMYSALNNYRGLAVKSTYCPHCGKYMTNHDLTEED